MKTLDVPFKSITDIKKSPMGIFNEAKKSNNGVYILNNNKTVGVALTVEQYKTMNDKIESLYDRIEELVLKERLQDKNRGSIPVNDVIGMDIDDIEFDENDGWE